MLLPQRKSHARLRSRRLSVEALEDRRMLATFTVTNLLDGPVAAAGDLPGSLRQAIFDANNTPGADDINVTGVSGTLLMTDGEFAITEALNILGPGRDELTIDASGNDPTPELDNFDGSRVFYFSSYSGALELEGITITGSDHQAAVSGNGGVTLSAARLTGNHNSVGTLHKYSLSGTLQVVDSDLDNNTAPGIVYGTAASVEITNSTIANNLGSGVKLHGSQVLLNDSVISGNVATIGGAIDASPDYLGVSTINIENSTISGNSATTSGNAIRSRGGAIRITNSTISGNTGSASTVSLTLRYASSGFSQYAGRSLH